jgi:hypothetical protein
MTSLRHSFLGRSISAISLFSALTAVGLAQTPAATAAEQSATTNPPATVAATPLTITLPPPAIQPAATKLPPKPTLSDDEFRAAFIATLNKPAPEKPDNWTIPLLTLLVSMFVSILVAKMTIRADREKIVFQAAQEKEKAKIDTALAYTTKMLNLKMRQLEFFYAPLLACTQQCKGIHAKLSHYLFQKADAGTLQWKEDGKGGKWLEIKDGAGWAEYRLLDQLPVLKNDPRAMALVDQILEIDAEMVKIIRRHNGLAAVETTISPLYGKFLGHYAVLSLERKGPPGAAYQPKSQEIGYYPRELDALIDEEYNKARCAVREYLEMSDTALQWLKKVKE